MTTMVDKINPDKFPIVSKQEKIKAEITELTLELNDMPSDEELIEWAKENHPIFREIIQLDKEIESKYVELEGLNEKELK